MTTQLKQLSLTEEEIVENYEILIKNIEHYKNENLLKDNNRFDTLIDFYINYADCIISEPASGKLHFHSCFPGGYVHHILTVCEFAKRLKPLYETVGETFTDEEMFVTLVNHDLFKVGDPFNKIPYYIRQTSDWHIKNQKEYYTHNPELQWMEMTDRTLYTLSQLGFKLTENEYIAIKIHDGLYVEGNKPYLISWSEAKTIKSNLPYLAHHADMLATRHEYMELKNQKIVRIYK